ncbi:MAG: tRNA lysidine(34) synthetase TilS [Thermodesulfovibrionales bacterium]|nr:tRNA lysidine(34) synthetase TilS [Thermodesulfovibrionales bacterium]
MDLIQKVRDTISKFNMIFRNDIILIALSGGADSVCLLKVLSELKDEFELKLNSLYIDHGLRPDEIPLEIEFCSRLSESLKIPFMIRKVDVLGYSKGEKMTKQQAARELRYMVFNEVAFEIKADKIALGHTADDQAETLLLRLIRGSGSLGLAGIPPVRQKIIRPLIEIERKDIEAFLDENNIAFVVDSSNLLDRYIRNKVRNFLIPEIKKINPSIVNTLQKTSEIFRDEERYFEVMVTKTMMKMISRKTDNHIELFLTPFEVIDTVLMRRVLRRAIDATRGLRGINFIHIEDIISLIKKGKAGDRLYLPNNIRVIKGYSILTITCQQPNKLDTYTLYEPKSIYLKEASLTLSCKVIDIKGIDKEVASKKVAYLDADKINFPLKIRSRKEGDYFYPFGLGKRKKLQDFFVDEKIPRDERDIVPLLINDNGDILWVSGYRIDDRYKINKDTKRVLKCTIDY